MEGTTENGGKIEHVPTLDVDGFEVIERQIHGQNGTPRFPANVRQYPLGQSTTIKEFHRYLAVDTERADVISASSHRPDEKNTLLGVLAESGFQVFPSDFPSHVVAARTKPQPTTSETPLHKK